MADFDTFSKCIEELIYNSLDASANIIEIKIDREKLIVVDNGHGIGQEDLGVIGKRFMTRKCRNAELNSLPQYYGYRGETIWKIVLSSRKLKIRTCSGNNIIYCRKIKFDDPSNVITQQTPDKRNTDAFTGSEISVYGLAGNQTIDIVSELEYIKNMLQKISLINPHVNIILRDAKSENIHYKSTASDSILKLFYQFISKFQNESIPNNDNHLIEVKHSESCFTFEGLVSKDIVESKTFQLIYVNKRFVGAKSKIMKILSHYLSKALGLRTSTTTATNSQPFFSSQDSRVSGISSSQRKKYPIFLISIICPFDEYDFICDEVKFRNLELLTKVVDEFSKNFQFKRGQVADPTNLIQIAEPTSIIPSKRAAVKSHAEEPPSKQKQYHHSNIFNQQQQPSSSFSINNNNQSQSNSWSNSFTFPNIWRQQQKQKSTINNVPISTQKLKSQLQPLPSDDNDISRKREFDEPMEEGSQDSKRIKMAIEKPCNILDGISYPSTSKSSHHPQIADKDSDDDDDDASIISNGLKEVAISTRNNNSKAAGDSDANSIRKPPYTVSSSVNYNIFSPTRPSDSPFQRWPKSVPTSICNIMRRPFRISSISPIQKSGPTPTNNSPGSNNTKVPFWTSFKMGKKTNCNMENDGEESIQHNNTTPTTSSSSFDANKTVQLFSSQGGLEPINNDEVLKANLEVGRELAKLHPLPEARYYPLMFTAVLTSPPQVLQNYENQELKSSVDNDNTMMVDIPNESNVNENSLLNSEKCNHTTKESSSMMKLDKDNDDRVKVLENTRNNVDFKEINVTATSEQNFVSNQENPSKNTMQVNKDNTNSNEQIFNRTEAKTEPLPTTNYKSILSFGSRLSKLNQYIKRKSSNVENDKEDKPQNNDNDMVVDSDSNQEEEMNCQHNDETEPMSQQSIPQENVILPLVNEELTVSTTAQPL